MSELCLSSTAKNVQFYGLLLSDMFVICSFILSHPLYFSYFIFFSPYLLKLLSFLSPLFITTSLLTLLTLSPALIHGSLPEPNAGLILSTYHSVLGKLHPKIADGNEDFHLFEDLEAFKIVFDSSRYDVRDTPFEVSELNPEKDSPQAFGALERKSIEPAMEEESLEGLLKEFDEFGNVKCIVEEKKVEPLGTKSDKVENHSKEEPLLPRGSEARGNSVTDHKFKYSADNGGEYVTKFMTSSNELVSNASFTDNGREYTLMMEGNPQKPDSNLGKLGSMRKEKEWKRTLACKLFEERHNVEGEEGMDMLWETYEMDSSKSKYQKGYTKKKINKKNESSDDDEEEEEEEVGINGQLCCLQALKLSTGKMNVGMGRSNLVKISKAIRGFGWLHNVTRHGKKRYN